MATKYNAGKQKQSSFKKIEETENSGFGNYMESTGGGKPFSTSNTRTTRENGKYRQANNDTEQARTSDGKFTYKSVNGKSIDPKYGPSRGKTVNPLLTGGVNGIKIEDVQQQFDTKKGDYWDKYKDKWYRKGSLKVGTDHKTRVAGEDIWEIARQRYDEVAKEFGGKIEWDDSTKEWVATEKGKESETFSEVKKGRKSESEKAAATTAQKTGEDTFVKESDDSISVKKGTQPTQKKQYNPHWKTNLPTGAGTGHTWKPKMATPTVTTAQAQAASGSKTSPAPSVSAPSASKPTVGSAQAGAQPSTGTSAPTGLAVSQSKYSADDLEFAKGELAKLGIDTSSLTVKELDDIIDEYFVSE